MLAFDSTMWALASWLALLTSISWAQENTQLRVPNSLEECYDTGYFMDRDNRLPMTLNVLINLIEKVENAPGYNLDMRQVAVGLLHRFRQDGIEQAPGVRAGPSILPYSPIGFQFSKFRILLSRLIPSTGVKFPNETLTVQERCSLHFMLSSSFNMRARGDEGERCNQLSQFRAMRVPRSVDSKSSAKNNFLGDVEFLDSLRTKGKARPTGRILNRDTEEPQDYDYEQTYSDINLIDIGNEAISQCPVENGVILTPYGTVAAGNLIAGIAAGLQPQEVQLRALLALARRPGSPRFGKQTQFTVDNRWAATLAGDLAEVALIQVPTTQNSVEVGANGAWNSTFVPKWYFLTQRQKLEMTDAEIRGGLDGLIIARNITDWQNKASGMKLSQLLKMYYSHKGVLDSGVRACNRKAMLTAAAPLEDLKKQTSSFAQVLDREMQLRVTLRPDAIVNFSEMAAEALYAYIPQSLNDLSCDAMNPLPADITESVTPLTDIYVYLDTTWQYRDIKDSLLYIFERLNIGPQGSRITLLTANDCKVLVNTTNNLGDVYTNWNSTTHEMYSRGFNLPNLLKSVQNLTWSLMNEEKDNGTVGGRSLVALIVPQMGGISEGDTNFAMERLQVINQEVPDLKFIYFGGGSLQRFETFVENPSTDLYPIRIGTNVAATSGPVLKRIKQLPRRIINYRCGPTWTWSDSGTSELNQFIQPGSLNFYRVHPNYFFREGGNRHVRIQAQGPATITVCSSRSILLPTVNQTTNSQDLDCRQMITDTYDVDLSNACNGYYTIHECPPLYLSVQGPTEVGSLQINCIDNGCEFPNQLRYVVQTENLGCFSGVDTMLASVVLILVSIFFTSSV